LYAKAVGFPFVLHEARKSLPDPLSRILQTIVANSAHNVGRIEWRGVCSPLNRRVKLSGTLLSPEPAVNAFPVDWRGVSERDKHREGLLVRWKIPAARQRASMRFSLAQKMLNRR